MHLKKLKKLRKIKEKELFKNHKISYLKESKDNAAIHLAETSTQMNNEIDKQFSHKLNIIDTKTKFKT